MCQVEQTRPLRNAGLRNAEGMPFRSLYRSLFDSCIYFPFQSTLKSVLLLLLLLFVIPIHLLLNFWGCVKFMNYINSANCSYNTTCHYAHAVTTESIFIS